MKNCHRLYRSSRIAGFLFLLFCFSNFGSLNSFDNKHFTTNNKIGEILGGVVPFVSLFALCKSLIGSSSSKKSNHSKPSTDYISPDDTNEIMSRGAYLYYPTNRVYTVEIYDRFDSLQKACSPCAKYGNTLIPVTTGSVVHLFCKEVASDLGFEVDWSTTEKRILTLNKLKEKIASDKRFRKRHVRHVESTFGKGYLDDHISWYACVLLDKLKEEQKKYAVDKFFNWFDKEEASCEKEASFFEDQELIKFCDNDEISELDLPNSLQEKLEEIQNFKEMVSAYKFHEELEKDSSIKKIVSFGEKQIKLYENELRYGTKENCINIKKRILAAIETLQNPNKTFVRKHELNVNSQIRAPSFGFNLNDFSNFSGNAIQHNFCEQTAKYLNDNSDLKNVFHTDNVNLKDLNVVSDLLDVGASTSSYAFSLNKEQNYDDAYSVLDSARNIFVLARETGKFLGLVTAGVAVGSFNMAVFPAALAKDFIHSPIGTVKDLVVGIGTIAAVSVRALYDVTTKSGEDFDNSQTGQLLKAAVDSFNSMTYEEKVYETSKLITEVLFPSVNGKLALTRKLRNSTLQVMKAGQLIEKYSGKRALIQKAVANTEKIVQNAKTRACKRLEVLRKPIKSKLKLFKTDAGFYKAAKKIVRQIEKPLAEKIKTVIKFKDGVTTEEIICEIRRALKELKCSAIETKYFQKDSILKGPFPKGMLLRVRSDIAEKAHSLDKFGYEEVVNHFNIEIFKGSYKKKNKISGAHVIVDDLLNVIDLFF